MSMLLVQYYRHTSGPFEVRMINILHHIGRVQKMGSYGAIRCLAVGKSKGKAGGKGKKGVMEEQELSKERIRKLTEENQSMFNFVKASIKADRAKLDLSDSERAEHKRIADEYNRQTSRADAAMMQDLAVKAWLQQAAIDAIPDNKLKTAALIVDEEPPPNNRPWPFFDTPPMVDFDITEFDGSKERDDDDN
jgi:hypothetical protein